MKEQLLTEQTEASTSAWWRPACGHVGLLTTLIVYTALGGLMFYKLEYGPELERLEVLSHDVLRERVRFLHSLGNASSTEYERLLARYEISMQEAARGGLLVPFAHAGDPPSALARWTHLQAIFFASTVLTTIGYGNITPSTFEGRLFCIVFALVGIPLTVSVMADLGGLVAGSLPRASALTRPQTSGLRRSLATAAAATSLLLLYIAAGSCIFITWERDWTFFDGFYFCFVTMTTIGFGDLVPSTPQYMLLCTLYTLVGLSLTSTIIEVVRQQYSQSWRHLQALAEALAAERGPGEVDLRALAHVISVSLPRGRRDKEWKKAVEELSHQLTQHQSKQTVVQIIVYESSV